ncbi:MAG: DUF6263 family protein [Bacteroidota bacterium]
MALLSVFWFHTLWAVTSLYAQEPRLSHSLIVGESYLLDIDIQQNTSSESINSEEISLYSRMKIELDVDSVGTNELIYLTARYRELLVSMLAPGMGIDINSGSGRDQMLTDMVNSLENNDFHLLMSTTGELKQVDGLVEIFTSLAAYPLMDSREREVILKTLEEVYGPDTFGSLFNLFTWVYPVIQPMSNWTNDMTYYFNTKPVKMVNRYILAKSTEDLIVIQGLGMLNALEGFHETTSMGEVKSTVSGSQTYDFQMDRTSGWLRKCVSRQRVMIETSIVKSNYLPAGLKIPSYTETVFEVKGSTILDKD